MKIDWSNIIILKRLQNLLLKPFYDSYGKPPYSKELTTEIKELWNRWVYDCDNPKEEWVNFYKFHNIKVDIDKLYNESKKEIEDSFNNNDTQNVEIFNIQQEVIQYLALKERNKATERVVQYLEDNYKFYSIRNNIAPEIWIYQDGIYVETGNATIKEITRLIFGKTYTSHIGNNIIAKIEADNFINADEFFNKEEIEYVPVENGLLNIFTKELIPFTPKKIFFNKLPVKYEKGVKCPNIIKHFENVLKNPKDIDTMQELFGDLLRKEYKYEKGVMFNGSGRNGKGKTLQLIKSFLGSKNCANVNLEQLENDQYAVGNLFGKMVNLAGDLSKTALKSTGRFKNCIGRDGITANRKNKQHLDFVNYAKMFFACNELPITYDNTEGFWSKWIYFDFPYKFVDEEEYKNLDEKDKQYCKIKNPDIIHALTEPKELTGLLNWALEGLERLDKQGFFSDSQTSEEIKNIWIRKSDSLRAFCMDYIEEEYDYHITKKEFQQKYSQYCRLNKIRATSDKYIKKLLAEEYGVVEDRISLDGDRIYVWQGIKFKSSAQGGCDTPHFHIRLGILNSIESTNTIGNLGNLAKKQKSMKEMEEWVE